MRVLTVQQPWAWAIFHGKDVENRTQAWGYRGPVAIHAGARWSERGGHDPQVVGALVEEAERDVMHYTGERFSLLGREVLEEFFVDRGVPAAPELFRPGAVLGVVQLVDVHHAHPAWLAGGTDQPTTVQQPACCESAWAEQSYVEHGGRTRRALTHLVLEDPIAFEPIPNVRGRLGLWTPDDDLAEAIAAGLEAAR